MSVQRDVNDTENLPRSRPAYEAMIRAKAAARIVGKWPDDGDAIECAISLLLKARRFTYEAAA